MKPIFDLPELLNLNGDPFTGILEAFGIGSACCSGCDAGCDTGCAPGAGKGKGPTSDISSA